MIDKKLLSDITDYCKLNDLNIEELVNKILRDGFMIEKYGKSPEIKSTSEKTMISSQKEDIKNDKIVENTKIEEQKEIDIYGE